MRRERHYCVVNNLDFCATLAQVESCLLPARQSHKSSCGHEARMRIFGEVVHTRKVPFYKQC